MTSEHAITRIFQSSAYTPEVVQQVLPLVYDEMRRLASHFLKSERADHSLMATELVHEAYVRLFGIEQISFNNRRHFFATAAMAMRRILIDHERRRLAERRISSDAMVPLDPSLEEKSGIPSLDLLALDEALKSLEEISPRQARVIELHFFGGLTESQIGDVLEISRPTVARDLRAAKLWLRREMRA